MPGRFFGLTAATVGAQPRRMAYRPLLALLGAFVSAPAPAKAQMLTYHAGFSTSWGEYSTTICTDVCGRGTVSSHKNLTAPMVGATLSYQAARPLRLDTGAFLTRKGWSVTTPTLRTVFIEVPAVMNLGYWPGGSGMGFSVGAGAALALGFPLLEHSHFATVLAAQAHATAGNGATGSIAVRYTRGLNRVLDFHVHAWTLILGLSPH